jgi:hypothetical protein
VCTKPGVNPTLILAANSMTPKFDGWLTVNVAANDRLPSGPRTPPTAGIPRYRSGRERLGRTVRLGSAWRWWTFPELPPLALPTRGRRCALGQVRMARSTGRAVHLALNRSAGGICPRLDNPAASIAVRTWDTHRSRTPRRLSTKLSGLARQAFSEPSHKSPSSEEEKGILPFSRSGTNRATARANK